MLFKPLESVRFVQQTKNRDNSSTTRFSGLISATNYTSISATGISNHSSETRISYL